MLSGRAAPQVSGYLGRVLLISGSGVRNPDGALQRLYDVGRCLTFLLPVMGDNVSADALHLLRLILDTPCKESSSFGPIRPETRQNGRGAAVRS
jgi:hypothetical protein